MHRGELISGSNCSSAESVAAQPMLVTKSGTVIDVKLVHPLKAWLPMNATESLMAIDLSLVQPSKALHVPMQFANCCDAQFSIPHDSHISDRSRIYPTLACCKSYKCEARQKCSHEKVAIDLALAPRHCAVWCVRVINLQCGHIHTTLLTSEQRSLYGVHELMFCSVLC